MGWREVKNVRNRRSQVKNKYLGNLATGNGRNATGKSHRLISVADRDERQRLRVAYNSIFRKLFGYRDWESVTNLQHALNRPTWEELIERRTSKFMLTVSQCLILN